MANFYAQFAHAARRFPDATAIELQTPDAVQATSYQDLETQAGGFAAWLVRQGLAAGDRAAILGDNNAKWIAAYLGILRIAGVAVPLDTAYKAAQVRTVVENAGAKILFTTPRYLETARAAVAAITGTRPTLCLLHGTADGIADAAAVGAAGPGPAIVPAAPHDAAVILYTSGTTSDPKGVVLTHANLDAERLAAFSVVDVTDRDAILGVLPLFHALAQMANLLLPLAVGGRVVFLENVSSTSLLQALQERGITIFACVPQFFYLIHQRVMTEVGKSNAVRRAVFRALLRTNGWLRDRCGLNPGRRWFARVHRVLGPKMRVLVTGGSKFDAAIGRDLYDLGFNLLNAYGLTETSGGATIMRPGDTYTTSVGHPLTGVEIRIAPRDQAPGDDEHPDGEILIRGPIIMREYFRRPDATADAIRDGWLHTGDLGRLDRDGRLYITGRKKEIIVLSSGKNLYPEEIEAHYRESPVIKELCVLGLSRPGEPAAERLHAVIVPDEDVLRARGAVNVTHLVRFELEGRSVSLPPHKRILTYDIWMEPLPRTSTNKIRRHEIEKRLRGQTGGAATEREQPLSDAEQSWLQDAAHVSAIAAIGERLSKPGVRPDTNLELDLALDSMERVELLTLVEQQFGRRVPPEARAKIFTVRQLVDAVRAGLPAGPAAAPGDAQADGGLDSWETIFAGAPDDAFPEYLTRARLGRAALFFVLTRLAVLVARLLIRIRTSGRSDLPAAGPFIICPNHQSYLDAFLLCSVLPFRTLRQVFFVGAAEYFKTPFMAWLGRAMNVVPVDADSNLVSAMRAGAAGLRLGKVLVLFPEGERSIDGELKAFRKGAAILSAHLDAPLVPVAMDGLFPLWPRSRKFQWRGLLPWRAAPVTLEFGPSLTVTRGQYAEGTAALRDAVGQMLIGIRQRT